MRPADFHNILQGSSGQDRIQILEETTKRFPFFTAAQVLLAREYWQEDHLDKQAQLEQASLRVADRTFLYNLLHGQIEERQVEPQTPVVEVDEKPNEITPSAETEVTYVGLPDELIPDRQLYDISMAPDLVSGSEQENLEDQELDFVGWLKTMNEVTSVEPKGGSKPKERLELIDEFLENDPKISKRKDVKFYSPQEMGRKSVEDDFGFVSETLAQIYEDQGDTEKAINAYRSLQLRFPEKSSYFAARLKKLEEQ